jgi:hypothetical protein
MGGAMNYNNMLWAAVRIVFCVLSSFWLAGVLISQDEFVRQKFRDVIQAAMSKTFECSFTTDIESICVPTSTITLSNVSVYEQPGVMPWCWTAPTITVHISWYGLLVKRILVMDIIAHHVQLSGYAQWRHVDSLGSACPLIHHLQLLANPPGNTGGFVVRRFMITDGTLLIKTYDGWHFTTALTAVTTLIKQQDKKNSNRLRLQVVGGIVKHGDATMVRNITGEINTGQVLGSDQSETTIMVHVLFPAYGSYKWYTRIDSKQVVSRMSSLPLFLNFGYKQHITTVNEATVAFDNNSRKLEGSWFIDAALLRVFSKNHYDGSGVIRGTWHSTLTHFTQDFCARGTWQNIMVNSYAVPDGQGVVSWDVKKPHVLISRLRLTTIPDYQLVLRYDYDKQRCHFRGHSCRAGLIPLLQNWFIDGNHIHGAFSIMPSLALYAVVPLVYKTDTDMQRIITEHRVRMHDQHLSITGNNRSEYRYQAEGEQENGTWHIRKGTCYKHGKRVAGLTGYADEHKQYHLNGFITPTLVYDLLYKKSDQFYQKGIGSFDVTIQPDSIAGTLGWHGGTLTIPHTTLLLQKGVLAGHYDVHTSDLYIDNLRGDFVQGHVVMRHGHFMFRDHHLVYAFVPLDIQHLSLGSSDQGFMALVTAFLMVRYEHGWALHGSVTADRLLVRANILSSSDLADRLYTVLPDVSSMMGFFSSDQGSSSGATTFDIHFATQQHAQVMTPFIEAVCAIEGRLLGTLIDPQLQARITLLQGSINFPYAPLFIKHGLVHILPSMPTNPTIDLVAQNSIKGYTVTMNVTGEVSDPLLVWNSSPVLQHEQIIALLLGGSPDSGLALALPLSLPDTVHQMLFSASSSMPTTAEYVKKIFAPLNKVRIVPSVTEQSGRGGLRGRVALEFDDRWRCMIEKNFNLTEDTRLELDYAVSDDADVRVFRDERGDVGSEIQLRWKF